MADAWYAAAVLASLLLVLVWAGVLAYVVTAGERAKQTHLLLFWLVMLVAAVAAGARWAIAR